jgi:uncharacterized membrane protein
MSLSAPKSKAAPATIPAAISKWSMAASINNWFAQHWLLAFNTGWGVFTILPWLAPVFMALGWIWPGRIVYFIYNFFCHQLPERSWFLFGPKFSYTQAEIAAAWGRTLPEISNELVRRQFWGTPELGWKVAWSDRMVAMYTSIFLFGLLYAILRQRGLKIPGFPWWLFLIFIVPMALDGTTHLINDVLRLHFRQTNEWAVLLTGGIFPPEFYVDDAFGSLNSALRVITGIFFGAGVVGFLWPIMEREFSPD